MPVRVSSHARNVKAVYRTFIDVVHFRKTDLKKLRERDMEDDEEGLDLFDWLSCPSWISVANPFALDCGRRLPLSEWSSCVSWPANQIFTKGWQKL